MYNLEERKKLFEMPEQLQRYRILIVIVDKKLVIFLEFRRDNPRTTDSKNNQDWMKRWFCKTKTIIIFRRNNRVILTIEIVINKKGEMQNKLLQKCFHYLTFRRLLFSMLIPAGNQRILRDPRFEWNGCTARMRIFIP